jgi:hypothetical protein
MDGLRSHEVFTPIYTLGFSEHAFVSILHIDLLAFDQHIQLGTGRQLEKNLE